MSLLYTVCAYYQCIYSVYMVCPILGFSDKIQQQISGCCFCFSLSREHCSRFTLHRRYVTLYHFYFTFTHLSLRFMQQKITASLCNIITVADMYYDYLVYWIGAVYVHQYSCQPFCWCVLLTFCYEKGNIILLTL